MAISKILYIGGCGAGYDGKHLRQALDYIMEPQKTGNGKWIAALNCQKDNIYHQMRQTKADFGKTDKRQGYHIIISFAEGEVDAETAFEIIGRFSEEYLGKEYEAVYAVHDNTAHIHGHVIFNSVGFRDGRKYRYEKGEWEKGIQPITNRLCTEYALSTIEISGGREKEPEKHKEWNEYRDGRFVWGDMIKRDIDACILKSATYESFLSMITDMGYTVKNPCRGQGKYLAIKPMGMERFRRCKSLGEDYTEERIRERIVTENLPRLHIEPKREPRIVYCRIKRYRKAKMSGMQKRYLKKLYQLGKLKKRPYSQVWKYRDDIRKMQKLQEDYLFLRRHGIHDALDVSAVLGSMGEKKKEISKEKSRVFKERARMKTLFDIADEIKGLEEFVNCYNRGEELFEKEYMRWKELNMELQKKGYSLEQMESLKQYYRDKIAAIRKKEKTVAREERIAGRLIREFAVADAMEKKSERKAAAAPEAELHKADTEHGDKVQEKGVCAIGNSR